MRSNMFVACSTLAACCVCGLIFYSGILAGLSMCALSENDYPAVAALRHEVHRFWYPKQHELAQQAIVSSIAVARGAASQALSTLATYALTFR